jgi:hypothetical protein
MASKKIKGSDSILYNAVKGTLVTTGALTADTWYKISEFGTASALPDLSVGSIFKTPEGAGDAITLASGDAVWPLVLTEVCKGDVEISGEMGVIETTDSCDYPYVTNLPDGFTSLSGSINTMLRFDEETDGLVSVTKELLKRFYTNVEDDGEGTYSVTAKDDGDLILMILLNKNATADGKVQNWLIVPAILNSVSNNVALKDVLKGDYGWTKGEGPASLYLRTIPEASA